MLHLFCECARGLCIARTTLCSVPENFEDPKQHSAPVSNANQFMVLSIYVDHRQNHSATAGKICIQVRYAMLDACLRYARLTP